MLILVGLVVVAGAANETTLVQMMPAPLREVWEEIRTGAGSAADAAPIAGVASVIDGDTIEIRGQRIRLHGIDAPESSQTCLDSAGKTWRCGQRAALALQDLTGRRTVSCDERDVDRYGRTISQCFVGDTDINEWLVERGLALAYRRYSHDYVPAENEARATRRGMWAGTFEPPWHWRRR